MRRHFFLYRPAANDFAGVTAFSDEDVMPIYSADSPLMADWKPMAFHGFDDNPPLEGDFPSLADFDPLPIASQRAWQALEPLIEYCCEALPIIHPSGKPFFIIHVMQTIDCLDEEASELGRRFDGTVDRIYRWALHLNRLGGKHIFKLPWKSGGDLLVDDEFRDVVEKNALKGLRFEKLPM